MTFDIMLILYTYYIALQIFLSFVQWAAQKQYNSFVWDLNVSDQTNQNVSLTPFIIIILTYEIPFHF